MAPVDSGDVLVFDLDGTLVKYNTFHKLLGLILLTGLPGNLISSRLYILNLILLRKLGLIEHTELKLKTMNLLEASRKSHPAATSRKIFKLSNSIKRNFRPELTAFIEEAKKKNVPCILATAAPIDYVEMFGADSTFDSVIATSMKPNGSLDEARYGRKLELVLYEIDEQGWEDRRMIFFTDHADDFPLCKVADFTYWYGSAESWTTFLEQESREINGAPQAQ